MTNLVLLADSYPYDAAAEQTFLAQELARLTPAFERVYVVPERRQGRRQPLPDEVILDESYAKCLGRRSRAGLVLQALRSQLFLAELGRKPWLLLRPDVLLRMALFVGRAESARRWASQFLAERGLAANDTVFYTFWFWHSALGLGLLKRERPGLTVVSRAHGADLYAERHQPAYIPCRETALSLMDAVFPDSDAGTAYLRARHPRFAGLFETARMAVDAPGFVTAGSVDGVFRVISCSFMVKVKRIDLLIRGLAGLGRLRPDQRIEWTHFGDGPERQALSALAASVLPANVAYAMPGYSDLAGLLAWYRSHPIDVFVNVSVSEGTPVAVMEAISCGIPVAATAVGGNQEIVGDANGILLPADPTAAIVAKALASLLDDPDRREQLRRGSLSIWRDNYCADKNYQVFAAGLLAIQRRRRSAAEAALGTQPC